MWNKNEIKYFQNTLLDWYASNKRDFPWRQSGTSNFELILSEILLQRTKAETVAKYYPVFFNKYPNWDSLVVASIEDLEEVFKPLGLYRHRASRLFRIV